MNTNKPSKALCITMLIICIFMSASCAFMCGMFIGYAIQISWLLLMLSAFDAWMSFRFAKQANYFYKVLKSKGYETWG